MTQAAAECESLIRRYYQKTEHPHESRAVAVILAQVGPLRNYRIEDVSAAIGALLEQNILVQIGDNAVTLTPHGCRQLELPEPPNQT